MSTWDDVALGDSLSSGVLANIFEPQLMIANIYQRIPFSRDEILFSEESAARCGRDVPVESSAVNKWRWP